MRWKSKKGETHVYFGAKVFGVFQTRIVGPLEPVVLHQYKLHEAYPIQLFRLATTHREEVEQSWYAVI
jgi:hypothetical protein